MEVEALNTLSDLSQTLDLCKLDLDLSPIHSVL